MSRKTATIERALLPEETKNYLLTARYKGMPLRMSYRVAEVRVTGFAKALDMGPESVESMKAYARANKCTHVRYVGDWAGTTKPRGGKL